MRCLRAGVVSYATAKLWFKLIHNGGFSLQDDLRSERPMEIDFAELKRALESESENS